MLRLCFESTDSRFQLSAERLGVLRSQTVTSTGREILHGKIPLRIAPHLPHLEPRCRRQGAQVRQAVLVRILRPNRLSFMEGDPLRPQLNALVALADQMHLNAPFARLIEGMMPEPLRLEIRPQLPVDAHE